ncbi:MAG: AAA family ATPase, partial [Psychrosphaera sp.]|nr:AAA family ATPase [Psychrosphaera sp.]
MCEGEERLRYWRGKVKSALGKNTAVIAEVIPSLIKLTGEIPDLPELPPTETEKRFHITFCHFIKALSSSGHPLVIFIDNLQWADSATLKLLAHQTIANQKNAVLMIGAYRDNEVKQKHPLLQMIENVELAQGRIKSITLNNLSRHHIHQIIIDSFACTPDHVRALGDLCFDRTQGNPLYVKQYLMALYEHKCIEFDSKNSRWITHLNDLERHNDSKTDSDGVVTLVTARLHRFDRDSQQLLAIAAHLGNDFSLEQLAIVSEKDLLKTAQLLFGALQSELLIPLDENYKFSQFEARHKLSRYRFNHDLIQQAAYQLIVEKDRPALQLNIARLLLKNTMAYELDNHLYNLLAPYNQGRGLITDPQEKARLLAFNIRGD